MHEITYFTLISILETLESFKSLKCTFALWFHSHGLSDTKTTLTRSFGAESHFHRFLCVDQPEQMSQNQSIQCSINHLCSFSYIILKSVSIKGKLHPHNDRLYINDWSRFTLKSWRTRFLSSDFSQFFGAREKQSVPQQIKESSCNKRSLCGSSIPLNSIMNYYLCVMMTGALLQVHDQRSVLQEEFGEQ